MSDERFWQKALDTLSLHFWQYLLVQKGTLEKRNKVISKIYPYSEFFHYDLIKNTTDKMEMKNENLVDMMNRRGERFMNIITDNKLGMKILT